MRRAVTLLLAAGALVAPASAAGAAFPDSTFDNICQYDFDDYWRSVPMIFGGKLTDGAGTELTSGAQLAVGDTVRLQDGTVSAILPSWIIAFAFDAGLIPEGDGELPVRAWLALEATNTAPGVVAPIALNTVARTHVVLTAAGIVDEQRSTITVVQAPIPTQTWTATGGELQVRQALGESLPPLPLGRGGADVGVRGSLYVEATLSFPSGEVFRLYLDCLQGGQVSQGSTFSDALPGTFGTFSVPAWTGSVGGSPLPGAVDADLLVSRPPPRAGLEQQAVLSGASLRFQLTEAQRLAWLGDAASVPVSGAVTIDGARSAEGSQTLALSWVVGGAQFSIPLPDSSWTAATADGVDLRGPRVLSLTATIGGQPRTLTLTRLSATEPYPFARILRAADPPKPIPTRTPVPTASQSPVATPAPTVTPPVAKIAVRSSALRVAGKRVSVSLGCSLAACSGTVVVRTTAKRPVTLTRTARYSIKAGRRATVKLTLSARGRSLLARSRKVSVRIVVKPRGAREITRKVTLRR